MRILGKIKISALLMGLSVIANGADPNAGLPQDLEFATDKELEIRFATDSLSQLETKARNGESAAQTELARRHLIGAGAVTNNLTALDWFQKAATNGFALAQYHLSEFYDRGIGVPTNSAEATRWLRLASDQGVIAAMTNLADKCLQKSVPELQPKDALRLYELAAEKGDLAAAVQLGILYSATPSGVSVDEDRLKYWLSFAASRNYIPAYSRIGWQYMQESMSPSHIMSEDHEEAHRWFSKGAELNDAACQYGMAMWEWNVHKSSPDIAEIRAWLLKAATANYREAFYQLGRISMLDGVNHSSEVKENFAEAADWFRRGADLGSGRAAAKLAALTASGTVKSSDFIAGLRRAADLDDAGSKVELAVRYLKGEGEPRNEQDAPLALIQSAFQAGNTRALLLLCDFYAEGKLVTQDRIRAMYHLFLAAAWGSEEAYDRIAKFRAAASAGGTLNDLQQAFVDYTSAIQTSKPEPAAKLGRRYMDGTYTPDSYQAYIWFSVAAKHQDAVAAEEAGRLLEQFDKATQERAKSEADAMYYRTIRPLPGF